jgi:hypothetical protein
VKPFLKILAVLLAAALLGAASFAVVIAVPCGNTIANNGPWQTDLAVGSVQTGLYMRARVALMGLFALRKTEAIYFIARADSKGRTLESRCDYRIEGRDLPARWWSVTALGWNYYLIPNKANRYSLNSANVKRGPGGTYLIRLSPEQPEGNWLPSGSPKQGRINLNLRLYLPEDRALKSPAAVELPRIVREGCR